ncbi:hypothetical protein CR513_25527, partial [Mucuna pruriens]
MIPEFDGRMIPRFDGTGCAQAVPTRAWGLSSNLREEEHKCKDEVQEESPKPATQGDGYGFGFQRGRKKIEGSSMFDTKGEPRIELKEIVEVLGLGSTINSLQKHNKVEDLDNPELQPSAPVQFAREP